MYDKVVPEKRTTMMVREKDAVLTIRVPSALKRALEERARSEGRSVANLVVRILEGEIRWQKPEKKRRRP